MTSSREFTGAHDRSNDDDSSSATIRAEIEKTRARLGETVEALGAQLNPTHLKERVKESVREATIGRVQHMASNTRDKIAETGRGFAQTIRENPLPAAMAAAGIGWLLISNRDQRPVTRRFTNGEPDEFAIPDESYGESGMRARVRGVAENVADKASDLTERAQDAARKGDRRARRRADKRGRGPHLE